jgi:hypothetical protein
MVNNILSRINPIPGKIRQLANVATRRTEASRQSSAVVQEAKSKKGMGLMGLMGPMGLMELGHRSHPSHQSYKSYGRRREPAWR